MRLLREEISAMLDEFRKVGKGNEFSTFHDFVNWAIKEDKPSVNLTEPQYVVEWDITFANGDVDYGKDVFTSLEEALKNYEASIKPTFASAEDMGAESCDIAIYSAWVKKGTTEEKLRELWDNESISVENNDLRVIKSAQWKEGQ